MDDQLKSGMFQTATEAFAYILGFIMLSCIISLFLFAISYSVLHTFARMMRLLGP